MTGGDLRVRMIAPRREQCGIADYAAHLAGAMRPLVAQVELVDPGDPGAAGPGCSIVHVQHQYFLFGGVAPWKNRFHRFAAALRAPAVMTAHELVEPGGDPLRRAAIALTNRRNLGHRAMRVVVVHTERDRDRARQCGARNRVEVIRHGVPAAIATPDRDACRRRLALDDRFCVLMPGFLSRRKGHLAAIEAMRALPGHCVLLIAGGQHPDDHTPYAAEVLAAAEAVGLDRVRITGYLAEPDLAAAVAAADLVVAPSVEESGSGSLALAFAHRRAIAASDIGPHREIAADTPGAIRLFAAGSPDALADAVAALERDRDALRALEAGAGRYAEAHSYARAAAETVALYRSVLEEAA